MKNSVNKGFMTYLFLFVGIVLGVVLVCFAIMYLSPGVEILGYRYVSEKNTLTINTYDGLDIKTGSAQNSIVLNTSGVEVPPTDDAEASPIRFELINKVIIKANHVDFNLVHSDLNKVIVDNSITGFTKAENYQTIVVTKSYNSATKVFTIVITDMKPDLTLTNNRKVNMYVKDASFSALEIEVETDSGSMNFGGNSFSTATPRVETYNGFKAVSKTGDVLISTYSKLVNSLDVTIDSANLTVVGDLGTESTILSNVNIEVKEGKINAENIFAGNSHFKGTRTFSIVGDISGNVKLSIIDGDFRTGDIGGNLVDEDEVVKNTRILLGEVSGDLTIPAGTEGDITAEKVGGITTISVTKASIKIKQADGQVDITTGTGNVNILISETNNSLVEIVTTSGQVIAIFQNVSGPALDNTITTNTGNITLYYETGLELILKAKTSNNIHFEASDITNPTAEEDGYVYGYPEPLAEGVDAPLYLNNLTLTSTSADIIVSAQVNATWELIEPIEG